MSRRQSLVSLAVALLCGGVLVLFTDVEVQLVRWVNCGPIATEAEKASDVCCLLYTSDAADE